jgi:hypothetical protein
MAFSEFPAATPTAFTSSSARFEALPMDYGNPAHPKSAAPARHCQHNGSLVAAAAVAAVSFGFALLF